MFYAVRKGRNPGIYETWDEAKRQVTGFYAAEFKKFKTREEAVAFLENRNVWKERITEDLKNDYLVAFTDGSFEISINRYSYGVLLLLPNGKEETLSDCGDNDEYSDSRNIIGEILGVLSALKWAVDNKYKKIKIYHDYIGLSKWAKGEWKATAKVSQMYMKEYNEKFKGKIEVNFVKVPAHTNIAYNDMADALAKYALSGKIK